jgi:hypothetical protein
MALRFGVLCNDLTFSAWEAEVLDHLLEVEQVELALFVVNDQPTASPSSLTRKVRKLFTHAGAWTLYRRYFVNEKSRALNAVDLSDRFSDVPRLSCRPRREGKYSEYFVEEDLEEIRSYDLDFLLRFGFGIIRGEILEAARYGVWSYHHDDLDKYRGRPPCFWEIDEGDPVTGAVLQRLTDRLDGGIVLKKGYFKTVDTSYAANRDKVYFGSVGWPAQVCRDLLNGCADYMEAPTVSTDAPLYYQPKRTELLRVILKSTWNYVRRQMSALLFADQWNVGVIDRPVTTLLDSTTLPPASWLPESERSTYVADPSSVDEETLLAEEFDYCTGRGHVSAFRRRSSEWERLGVAIDEEDHLSYPYVLQAEGRTYCVPESAEAGEVVLYEKNNSPLQWTRVCTLIEEPVLDPTLIHHEGRWWLFGTLKGHYDNTKLFLWTSDALTQGWVRHPGCPVKCDVRSARPAGRPFVHEGDLYRPAQDCSREYGGAVAINRVVHMTSTQYEEEIVSRVRPDPNSSYSHGTHTLMGANGKTLVDAKQRTFIPSSSLEFIKRKGRRLLDNFVLSEQS